MAKHYYTVEIVANTPLDEDEVQELEDYFKLRYGWKVSTEYVDSEG